MRTARKSIHVKSAEAPPIRKKNSVNRLRINKYLDVCLSVLLFVVIWNYGRMEK